MLKFTPQGTGGMPAFQVSEFNNATQSLNLVETLWWGILTQETPSPKEIKVSYLRNASSALSWRSKPSLLTL